jgi:HlyD family secretion protein
MKKKYWIILIVVAVAAAAAAWFIFRNNGAVVSAWRTAKVEKGDINITVTASGTLSAVTTVQVGTQVSGTIAKLFVDFNSVVRAGQVIAILDTTYLAAAVADASASLERARIQVEQTRLDYERNKILFEQKVIAQADYDASRFSYETAVSNVRSVKATLDRAKINLHYATITAPISGVVVSRAVDVGQTVAASFNTPTLFTIANDLTKMQLQASIDEADIGKIKVGQQVDFTVDAYDNQTFGGTVSQIRLQPTVTQNVVTYTVIIDVPNPEMKLLPGMTANITVNIENVRDVLKVPSAALRFTPPREYLDKMAAALPDSVKAKSEKWNRQRNVSGPSAGLQSGGIEGREPGQGIAMQQKRNGKRDFGMIWIKEGDNLRPVRVKTGLSDGSFTEIRGPVNEGEEVVTGMTNSGQATTTQQQNPFAPQQHGRGGR